MGVHVCVPHEYPAHSDRWNEGSQTGRLVNNKMYFSWSWGLATRMGVGTAQEGLLQPQPSRCVRTLWKGPGGSPGSPLQEC